MCLMMLREYTCVLNDVGEYTCVLNDVGGVHLCT